VSAIPAGFAIAILSDDIILIAGAQEIEAVIVKSCTT
jgi:hypothetical protein